MNYYIPLTGVMLSDEPQVRPAMSEMGRCRDCRFWREGLPFGTCYRISGASHEGDPLEAGGIAYVDPDDPYIGAPLRTRSTFGCTLFREIDE